MSIPENCGTGHCSCISCVQVCQWTPVDSEDMPGTWQSACGEIWSFVEGGPAENNYRFCHGCGKPVELAVCTCPSGDGSLRWPCPDHGIGEQA